MENRDNMFEFKFNQLLLEEERIFKLSSASFLDDETVSVTLLLDAKNYDEKLDSKLKNKVFSVVKQLLPQNIKSRINFKKTISDLDHIKKEILIFFYNSSSFLYQIISNTEINVAINYNTITVSICIDRDVYSYLNGSKYIDNLIVHLDELFLESTEIILIPNDKEEGDTLPINIKRSKKTEIQSIKLIDIDIVEIISGSIKKAPMYICEIADSVNKIVTVCGKISKIEEKVSKNGKNYFVFNLNDTTGTIKVMYFTRTDKIKDKFKEIKEGDLICAEGELKSNDGKSNFYILCSSTAICNIDFSSIINEVKYKEYPEDYEKIFPQPYVDKEQLNLFVEDTISEQLLGTFVIFDLETTGLSATNEKITEIGAIKMVDGVIVETFTTLINPEVKLKPEIIKITNITDEMLENQPKFEEVIADFYKFTQNATLVAQNAGFDMGFISYHAGQHLYKFDNNVLDTVALAKEKVILKKYNLGYLCDYFNIPLTGAHRALNDAIATAKLFKKLVNLNNNRKK